MTTFYLGIINTNTLTNFHDDQVKNITISVMAYFFGPAWPTLKHDPDIIKIVIVTNYDDNSVENTASSM